MTVFGKKIKWIIIICIFLCSCADIKFTVKVKEYDLVPIYNLMVEINDKAFKNDIDYFRQAAAYKFITEDEKVRHLDTLRLHNKEENYTDDDLLEDELVRTIESLINAVKKVNIVKTYKTRAYVSNSGINFDYHWDEKNVHFQMSIKEYETQREWKLSSIVHCR
ncbi:MAG: hypothetical protein LBQ82_05165 [Treponema sp.]|jgi:hypothetical protein|nr:hypothetical protein [Treponema sp.]